MNKIFLTIILLCIVLKAKTQVFYETSWVSSDITYTGFVIFFDDDQAIMRVRYSLGNNVKVAEFDCFGAHFSEEFWEGYILDGKDASIVYGSEDSGYNADNFIFIKDGDSYTTPLTIDDYGLEQSNIGNYLHEVTYWTEISQEDLTDEYLQIFFLPNDPLYVELISINNSYDEPSENTNVTLHLIVVSNTMIDDIGDSCTIDRNHTVDEITSICEALGITIEKTIIDGSQFSKRAVSDAISILQPSEDDIVLFVYSGHGFRWSNQESSYPNIDLRYSRYQSISNENSFNLGDIYNEIIQKGARLNIILGDCCNSDVGVSSRSGQASIASRNHSQGNIEKLEKLFLNSSGNLIAAAAKPFQTACGSSADGGYFLDSFFNAINKETSELNAEGADWDDVIVNTINSAYYKTQNLGGCEAQKGIYYSTIE